MSALEKDVELNRLMISAVNERLSGRTAAFREMLQKAQEGVLEQAGDAYAVLFAAFPQVDRLSWTQTSGEYDDSSYSGFTMGNYAIQYVVGTEYEAELWTPSGSQTRTIKYGMEDDGELIEPEDLEWIETYEITDEQLRTLIINIEVFQGTFDDVFERAYNEGVRIVVTRDGVSTEEYYT